VHIKWGKQTFNEIEVDLSQDGLTLKSQIYALTNVPVAGQKIMAKGKILKVSPLIG
jgi:ubiquitin carboxyl-terminal hydrolase 14